MAGEGNYGPAQDFRECWENQFGHRWPQGHIPALLEGTQSCVRTCAHRHTRTAAHAHTDVRRYTPPLLTPVPLSTHARSCTHTGVRVSTEMHKSVYTCKYKHTLRPHARTRAHTPLAPLHVQTHAHAYTPTRKYTRAQAHGPTRTHLQTRVLTHTEPQQEAASSGGAGGVRGTRGTRAGWVLDVPPRGSRAAQCRAGDAFPRTGYLTKYFSTW